MAKYIILNGKVYNIKWPKKLYYFDKTLIAKCLFLILLDTFRLYKL